MRIFKYTIFFLALFGFQQNLRAQCTLTDDRTFANLSSAPCAEGGNPSPGDLIIIPSGRTLDTSANNQNITYDIEIGDGGEFRIDNNNAVLNGSIKVKNGGFFNLDAKLTMPSGETLAVEAGGDVDSGPTGSDRLTIGTTVILSGTTPCTDPDGSSDTNPPYCAADGFSGPTAFDENGETPSILPIVLGSFDVYAADDNISLEWQTITEENFDFFSVERSEDGEYFYEIGTVPGNGNSTEPINYSFEDTNPLFGTAFYRLNAIDFDGSYEKFQILAVDFVPETLQVSLYPNPTEGNRFTLRLGLPRQASIQNMSIIDLQGRSVLEQTLTIGKNEFDFSSLRQGFYLAKIQIDNFISTRKIVVN